MATETVILERGRKNELLKKLKGVIPDGGNLNLCLACGMCSSGCPATGIDGMDPRKMLRMVAMGLDDLVLASDWPWMCTMCQRCIYVCPMQIDIPQLIYNIRAMRPREDRPRGILGSCDMALKTETNSAMGATQEDFEFVVEDVLEQYRKEQPEFEKMEAPIDKVGAQFFINQNSREPVTEADEMVPLWKILHLAGVDWTYGSKGWAGENYCMFLADNDGWEHIVRTQATQTEKLKCKTYLNTE